ncbi:MotA/TolQ/ExbB proton channel family protein [Thermodesulfatator autotrophicus]|uniref:MotA/TolQ/ExbB proton channel domain-containing protein n=1 Tax=Thermodesulfatator autotrophicus TaxID=1795632 RepID=A0A177E5T8_9BACT|nr:MotA/TolQ/ExbB proton channel family protein [Thermodesulfatator autotrophicus]OAG27148.1 hypothetical protein TH606_08315 [Thermodesulfatator autotrophicus]
MNLWHLIFQAGLVAKITLLLLLFMSISTWAVIFTKWRQFKEASRGLKNLTNMAEKSSSCQELASKLRQYKKTAGWNIARYLLGELVRLRQEGALPEKKELFALWLEMFIKRLNRYLNVAREREISNLKEGLSFLAITGNSAPFIGLFGTVWGIMTAFHQIGLKGSASLATVAPGIAEALIATALGLFAAIPASMAYNYFAARLENLEARLQELGEVIILLIEKEFMHEIMEEE